MKIYKIFVLVMIASLLSCGGKEKSKRPGYGKNSTEPPKKVKEVAKRTLEGDLLNKGIGPIKTVDISKPIDQEMVAKGEAAFKSKCSACHKINKKFIGPSPKGILERRSPEWVMNMIMNPGEMIKKDPIAMDLLKEYNGSPMANQNMSKEDTRAIIEYYRTLK